MADLTYSKKLSKILATRVDAAYEQADATCENGYDNDGSTGSEIFANGLTLGMALAEAQVEKPKARVFAGETDSADFFLIASDEAEACARAKAWPEDPEDDGEEEDPDSQEE